MSKHYHVLVGLRGLFMPDDNRVCRTRRQAEAVAREIAGEFREYGDDVRGSSKDGYYAVGDSHSVEISVCDMPECLDELDD